MRRLQSIPTRLILLLAIVAGSLYALRPHDAAAHPLGNFTVNRYARIEPAADSVRLVYALDMAEIPTFQEMSAIDRDRNGTVSDAERGAYLDQKLPELARNVQLTVGGVALALRPDSGTLRFEEGQGGLQVLRIDAVLLADLPASARSGVLDAQVRDTNYDDRVGWKELVVRGTDGATVRESSVGAEDVSDMLRSYPADMLQSPLNQREARFRFEPGVADAGNSANPAARIAERTKRVASPGILSRFADSAATKDLTVPVMLFSLLAAIFWGALHALGPGHGKTVVAAYLVGSRGTAKHAAFLGLTVTATHTASTYLLGAVTLFASHFIVPERLYPILSLASGLMVIGMGLTLLSGRLRGNSIGPSSSTAPTAALDRGHGHNHGFGQHGHSHTRPVPGVSGRPVTWRSLLALGMYGGMIPCPTAIVVLLISISLNRVGFGLLLVVAFSLGLAAVLMGIGFALVYAGRAFSRVSCFRGSGMLAATIPIASAALVIAAGLLITLRAAGQEWVPVI